MKDNNNIECSTEFAGIASKLAKIKETIVHPTRSEHVSHGDFHYATRDDIFETARIELAKHNVSWIPSMTLVSREDTGGSTSGGSSQTRHHIRVSIQYIDGDSGEGVTQTWDGESIHHDEKGIQMAGTQAVRFALTNMFMLLDGAEMHLQDASRPGADENVHREKAPPEDATQAILEHLRDLEFSDEQIGLFGEFIAYTEDVEVVTDVPEAKMRAWYDRLVAKSDKEARQSVMKAISGLDEAA